MSKETTICKVYGFEIKKDSLYEVVEKIDHNAPDGFKEYNTSKVLSAQFEDSKAGALYDSEKNIWDTGLYPSSKSFKQAFGEYDDSAVKSLMAKINNYIVTPYEKEKGENILRHTTDNNNFWDNYQIKITVGKVFDTKKVDDLLNLYLLLIHRRLTPKGYENHPLFLQPISDYLIVDKSETITAKAEKAKHRFRAIKAFGNLLEQDNDKLISILDYLGIQASKDTDEDTLNTLFDRYLEDKEYKDQNAKLFLEAVEYSNTDEGDEVLFIHKKLKEMNRKSSSLVSFRKGQVFLEGSYVENGWKNAAKLIQKDKELREIFDSLQN